MKNYDFIILGGGPAGLRIGEQLAGHGFNILLIEKDIIGRKSRSWISWSKDLERFGLSAAIKNRIQGLYFKSFLGAEYLFDKAESAVVDTQRLLEILNSRARSRGAAIHEQEAFCRYKLTANGVDVHTDKSAYHARYLIDAMGYDSIIQTGLAGALPGNSLMGCFAYELEGLQIKESRKAVIFDAAFPGRDYFWFIPYSDTAALAGCFFFEALDEKTIKRGRESLGKYLEFFKLNGQIKTTIAGNIPLAERVSLRHGRIFFAGDSASTPLPSSGYGLVRTLDEAGILAQDLIKGFSIDRFNYEKDVLEKRYPGFELHYLVSDILRNMNDPLLNKAISQMNVADPGYISRFLCGDDLSLTFAVQTVMSIFNTFTIQELTSMALRRDYKELLFHFARIYPRATPSIIKKELGNILRHFPWYKAKKSL